MSVGRNHTERKIIQLSIFQMARINLAVTTFPAALEVCAASRLVEAGLSTAKITADIGRCSATSAFSALTGSDVPASNVEDFAR